MSSYDWSSYTNILCIRPDNMGDVLMTQPALRALKEMDGGPRLTLLTSSMGGKMAERLPEVDEVLVFDLPWIKTAKAPGSKRVQKLVRELQKRDFNASVVFTNYSQSSLPTAMIAYLADIPNVMGYSRENPYQLLTHWIPDDEPFTFPVHGVQRQLDLVAEINAFTDQEEMFLPVCENAEAAVVELLKEWRLKRWLILHPGVSEDKRRYSLDGYGEVASHFINKGYKVLVTGSSEEKHMAEKVTRESGENAGSDNCINLAGKLSLDRFIALIQKAPVVISNNTAPVHIAAAVNTPVVDVYARTNPEHTPWKVSNRTCYFDVPQKNQSRNTTLTHTTPTPTDLNLQPKHIASAAEELLNKIPDNQSTVPLEIRSWSHGTSKHTNTNIQQKQSPSRDSLQSLLTNF